MKRAWTTFLAFALLAGGVSAFAKGHDGMKGRMMERLKEKLELTDDQAEKLAKAFKAHRSKQEDLGDEARDARRKLARLVRDEAGDKEISAAMDRLDAAQKARLESLKEFDESLAGFLKPVQRAKLRLAAGKMMGKHRGRGRGHGRREPMLE